MSIFRVVGPKKIDRLVTQVRKYGFDVLENHVRCAEKPEFGWWPLLMPRVFCTMSPYVERAVFSPDGRRVLTASSDKTARLCRPTTITCSSGLISSIRRI
jgi:WD40 repeat protein